MRRGGRRGSVLDLFLVLLLSFCLVGAILRHREKRDEGLDNAISPYLVTAVATDIPRETAECLGAGEVLYTVEGEKYGVVTSVESHPARWRVISNGVWYEGDWPEEERCDLTVTVELQGSESGGALLRQGRWPLLTGQRTVLYSNRGQWSLEIRFFRPMEDKNS